MITTVPTGITPNTVAVDQVRNQIYVANGNANCLPLSMEGPSQQTPSAPLEMAQVILPWTFSLTECT